MPGGRLGVSCRPQDEASRQKTEVPSPLTCCPVSTQSLPRRLDRKLASRGGNAVCRLLVHSKDWGLEGSLGTEAAMQ